jgi:Aerotolerance regulator N-terminal/von Willebrand factor type A domain
MLGLLLGFGLTQIGMLWWLAAAAAPLLIHLLSRRRYREVPWAAVEYLLAALQKSTRRLRAEQWILLLLRMLTIVCVVIAVAGPYLEQLGGTLAVGQPVHRILVIDGSYSMGYKPGERNRFDLAKQYARDIVARSSPGDGFSLVLMSAPARVVVGPPAFVSDDVRDALQRLAAASTGDNTADAQRKTDEDDFLKQISTLKLPHGGGNLADALDRVDELIARARQEYPRLATTEVYFLTDLGRTSWDLTAVAGGAHSREKLAALAGANRLAIVDLGQDHCENLAITGLRSDQPVYTTKSPIGFQTEVHNFGSQPHHAQIELLIDGQRFQQRAIDIAAGTQQTIAFAHRFEAPGDHAVEARLSGDPLDALDIDNHRWLSVPVKESLEALIVNGEGSREEARYLFNALNPYRDGSEPLPVHVEEMSDGRLLETDLHRFDCVFLANVSRFTPAEARILADYAKSGGGLVFFLGDRVDPQNYNQELGGGRPNTCRLLPMRLDQPTAAGRYTFDPLGYKDPIVHEFQGNERAGLLSTAITRYFKLKRPDDAAAATPSLQSRIALGIRETGDPAIVAAPIAGDGPGDRGGWSIVVAIPASFASVDPSSKEPWSNWPMKYSFQPVVQNLLLAAIGPQGANRNVLVGKPLESSMPAAHASSSLSLEKPDGHKEQIRIAARDNGNRWSYADTWLSGIYRADFAAAGEPARADLFAVNVDTSESDLAKISKDQLPDGLTVVSGWNGLDQRPAMELGSRMGQQRWFLYAALGFMLLETILAFWFGYRAS